MWSRAPRSLAEKSLVPGRGIWNDPGVGWTALGTWRPATDVLPGNGADKEGELELTEEGERNAGAEVGETIGDCAYGDGATREDFAEANRSVTLLA